MADTQLVYALQNRQNGAMEQFQTAYTPLLRYIIAPILPDERDREECLSDVLLRVWDSIGAFDPGRAALTTWLTPTRCPLNFWPPASMRQAGSGGCTNGPQRASWPRKESIIPESIESGVFLRGSVFRTRTHSSTPLNKTAPQPCERRVAVLCYQYLFQQRQPPHRGRERWQGVTPSPPP